jgi:DNA-binding SARP family transcriptional activator/TolB-like protein
VTPCWALDILGPFSLRAAGRAQPLRLGRKWQGLLACLAVAGAQPVARGTLAALLWGEHDARHARHSLNQALTGLRAAGDGGFAAVLRVDAETIALGGDALAVDLHSFEAALRDGRPPALVRVLDLYRGELLEGLAIAEPLFDEWLLLERQRLREAALDMLGRLLAVQCADQEWNAALVTARRLVRLEPFDEATHCQLIRLYRRLGRHGEALRQFEICRDVFARNLGIEPGPAIREAFREALDCRKPVPASHGGPPMSRAPSGRPSIAVTPFLDPAGDVADGSFVRGLTEDIVTCLSRFRSLFVIARGSSFALHDRGLEAVDAARRLGVQYVLGGTIRRQGERLRIAVGLSEAVQGRRLWGFDDDRAIDEIEAVQQEIVGRIVALTVGQLEVARLREARRLTPGQLGAYDLRLRGRELSRRHEPAAEAEAQALLERATALAPDDAAAWAELALTHLQQSFWDDAEGSVLRARELAAEAIRLDPREPWGHLALGLACLHLRHFEAAERHTRRAVELNVNDPALNLKLGLVLANLGQSDEAIRRIETAMALNPLEADDCLDGLALAYFAARRYADVIRVLEPIAIDKFYHHVWLAAAWANAGDVARAGAAATRCLELAPDFTISRFARCEPVRDPAHLARFVDGLRAAGVPE